MTTIITKNSSTASATPAAGDLTKGELAINVTDKKLYTKDNSATVVRIVGSLGNQEASAAAITGGTVAGVAQTGGTINNTPIGGTTAAAITGTTVTATTGFVGAITGAVTGNVTGNLTGNVTGNVTGNLTGNVTASTGTSSFNDVTINGGLNMDASSAATITNLTSPTNSGDAATKGYVDTAISNLVDGAPAALDTLNELAAALNDDASFSTTVTNSIAAKLPLAGGTMTGAIAMGTSKITGLGTPTAGTDATTKTYVDGVGDARLTLIVSLVVQHQQLHQHLQQLLQRLMLVTQPLQLLHRPLQPVPQQVQLQRPMIPLMTGILALSLQLQQLTMMVTHC